MSEQMFRVVVNQEGQYSIIAEGEQDAAGWLPDGTVGSKQHCLDHIDRVWTDMRPISLRSFEAPVDDGGGSEAEKENLVSLLCSREHAVTATSWPKSRDISYVHLRFTTVRGETELPLRIASNETSQGVVRVRGDLVLDFVPLTCIAEVDVASCEGTARLVRRA